MTLVGTSVSVSATSGRCASIRRGVRNARIIKPMTMKNNCENYLNGKCKLTAHEHDGKHIVYVRAYPDNCEKCKDYKPISTPQNPLN